MLRFLTVLTALIVVAGGCRTATDDGPAGQAASGAEDLAAATDRAVAISTTSCGYAPPGQGFGVAVSDELVLTVAHLLAGSTEVTVGRPDRKERDGIATVAAYDPLRDLALLEVDLDVWAVPDDPIRFQVLDQGEEGLIIGDGEAGPIPFTVADRTRIEMDEVRGTRRSQRSGYRLEADTGPGDSGSGLYDVDGRLAGILFAVSTEDGRRSWATAADEVEAFLADPSVRGDFACNPDRSRLEPVEGG